jgi:hypothetical protein
MFSRRQRPNAREGLIVSGIAGFCIGFCLVMSSLWAGPVVPDALAAPSDPFLPTLPGHDRDGAAATGCSIVADNWAGETATVTPSSALISSPATGALVPPLPDYSEITLPSRSFDTRDWLFIVSWQASRGERGGMRASSVVPSKSLGLRRVMGDGPVTRELVQPQTPLPGCPSNQTTYVFP